MTCCAHLFPLAVPTVLHFMHADDLNVTQRLGNEKRMGKEEERKRERMGKREDAPTHISQNSHPRSAKRSHPHSKVRAAATHIPNFGPPPTPRNTPTPLCGLQWGEKQPACMHALLSERCAALSRRCG